MQEVEILRFFIKNDGTKTGLNWFKIIFFLCGPSGCGLCEKLEFPYFLHTLV